MMDITNYISKILTVDEYYIDTKTNMISSFEKYADNLETKYSEGTIRASGSIVSDDKGPRYETSVTHTAKKNLKDHEGKDVSGSKFELNFNSRLPLDFNSIRRYIDGMMEKSLNRTTPYNYKCFRYEDAKNKTDEDFIVTVIDVYNHDIDITVNSDYKIGVADYNAVVSLAKSKDGIEVAEDIYTFFNNGYRLSEYEGLDVAMISDLIFKSDNTVLYDDLYHILNVPEFGVVPNVISVRPLKDNKVIEYVLDRECTTGLIKTVDKYSYNQEPDKEEIVGLMKEGGEKVFCLYEEEGAEGSEFFSSLTYRFYDSSFLGVPTKHIYELSQVDYGYDDRFIKYTKSTFEVHNPEEFEEAVKAIKEANPMIVIIKQLEIPEENI